MPTYFFKTILLILVEMEGVEPSSKILLNINQRSIVARTGFEPVTF